MAGRVILLGAAIVPALGVAVGAQPKYDVSLERAAMTVIAGKIGDIRPGFGYGQKPSLVVPGAGSAPPAGRGWQVVSSDHGAERRSSGSILSFSDGLRPTMEELRAFSPKTVSRVIKF